MIEEFISSKNKKKESTQKDSELHTMSDVSEGFLFSEAA